MALKKKRAPRQHRAFTYRGVSFFLTVRGPLTEIAVIENGTTEPKIIVSSDKAMEAVKEIARIVISEAQLEQLNRSNPNDPETQMFLS